MKPKFSPKNSLAFVLSLGLTPSFGTFTFILNMLFLFGQILILKKEFPKLQFLQIPVTVLFGLLISIRADLITTPGNALVQAFSIRTGKKFGNIKINADCFSP